MAVFLVVVDDAAVPALERACAERNCSVSQFFTDEGQRALVGARVSTPAPVAAAPSLNSFTFAGARGAFAAAIVGAIALTVAWIKFFAVA